MGFEVFWLAAHGVCFAEDAGEALPAGEDFGGSCCCFGLVGHTASVWRRFWLRRVVRMAWREQGQRTAAIVAIVGVDLDVKVVDLRGRDLQVLFGQVVHFVVAALVVVLDDEVICR